MGRAGGQGERLVFSSCFAAAAASTFLLLSRYSL